MFEIQSEVSGNTTKALTGVILQITTRYSNEYAYDVQVVKKNDSNGHLEYELLGGYSVDVFLYLQSLLNFTYKLQPNNNPYQIDSPVQNGSTDIFLSAYSLLVSRTRFLDPTFVIGHSRIFAFLDHNFESNSNNHNTFIVPFELSLWICMIVVWGIFLASFLFLNRYETDSSMGDIVFHCITVTLQKGTYLKFCKNSTQIATVVLSFTIVIIMASYSGIMTSISAVNRYTVNSIDALLNSNYKILLEYGSTSNSSTIKIMLQALMNMSSVIKLLSKVERSKFVYKSFEDAIRQVKNGPSAYVIDEETGANAIDTELGEFPCTWSKIPVFNLKYPWVMYMKKNASYKNLINSGIIRIRERGVLKRIRTKWIPQQSNTVCFSGSDSAFKSISFPQVSSAFGLLVGGMVIACPFFLFLENLFFCHSQASQQSSKNSKQPLNDFNIFYVHKT